MNADMKQIKQALSDVKGIVFYYDADIERFVVVCSKQHGVTTWQDILLEAMHAKPLEGWPLASFKEYQADTNFPVFTVRS